MDAEKHQVIDSLKTPVPHVDRQTLNDEQLLASLGHKQELRRDFSIWSLGCLCLCLMATWEALSSVVATALISGGAPCLFYN